MLGEPLGRKTLGCNSFCKNTVNLDIGLKDKVRECSQAGYPILERETCPHRKNAKINLLEVKPWDGSGHNRESKMDRAVPALLGTDAQHTVEGIGGLVNEGLRIMGVRMKVLESQVAVVTCFIECLDHCGPVGCAI